MRGAAVAAAILAGGRARRLGGVIKSTLSLPGWRAPGFPAARVVRGGVDEGQRHATRAAPPTTRIIDWQVAALVRVADPVFVIAPDPQPFASLGLQVVPDILPGMGALGGIYTAIMRSPCDRTLVVAGDMPFLPAALLRRLVGESDADIVIPRAAGGYEPLCAVYARACADPIRRRIEAGQLRASEMPADVRVEEIGPELLGIDDPDGLLFVNVNTPHDYERARALVGSLPQQRGDRITD